ncbi:hypothetical protein CC80DRAFT_590651 [Byssothecium circinans]|uniref:Uncharacterized protein n=1 Tax=Byssothecium circinans TaxID=147558 RepID=A0A6A5UH29_9PLEO|nr:hypothetical protein CC80DRAFT_590651 [Byssothecium circinans]
MPNAHLVAKVCYVQKYPVPLNVTVMAGDFLQQLFWYIISGLLPTLVLCFYYYREHIPQFINYLIQVYSTNNPFNNGVEPEEPGVPGVPVEPPPPHVPGQYEGRLGFWLLVWHVIWMHWKLLNLLLYEYAPKRGQFALRQIRRSVRHHNPSPFARTVLGTDESDDQWLGDTNWELIGRMMIFNNYYIWPMTHDRHMFMIVDGICLPEFAPYPFDGEVWDRGFDEDGGLVPVFAGIHHRRSKRTQRNQKRFAKAKAALIKPSTSVVCVPLDVIHKRLPITVSPRTHSTSTPNPLVKKTPVGNINHAATTEATPALSLMGIVFMRNTQNVLKNGISTSTGHPDKLYEA